jgi:transmembrane 9 superfamily protein 3
VALLSVAFYYNHPLYRRGTVLTAFTLLYAFTSFIGGYVSGSYYSQHGGQNWIRTMFLTALLFPSAAFGASAVLDFVALFYGSMASISIGTLLILILLFGFVSLPLTFAGTVVGRNRAGTAKFPCRIHPVPKPIPPKKAYQELWVHALLGGVLPFGSIFIEMYFVFTAIWQYKYYYVFGFLLLVFSILIVVTVCSTIVSTYFLLNAEDYRWQWTSFYSGSSTAIYVYLYAIYYFFKRTHMSGFLQVTIYFSYMALMCFGVALITGAAGFLGARMFVHRIFRAIHVD